MRKRSVLSVPSVASPPLKPSPRRADIPPVSTRRARVVTADQWGKPERNESGHPVCRWCRAPVTPPRRTFCGDACVHEWKIRSSPWYVRQQVKKRDKGTCRLCGFNVVKAHREWTRSKPPGSDRAARRAWRARGRGGRPITSSRSRTAAANAAWRITACCAACHVSITLAWRAQRHAGRDGRSAGGLSQRVRCRAGSPPGLPPLSSPNPRGSRRYQPSRRQSRLSQRLEGFKKHAYTSVRLDGRNGGRARIGAIPPPERVAATPIPETATAIRIDGQLNDAAWQTGAGDHRIPSARSERRRARHLRDRSARRLRRDLPLHRRPRLRPRAARIVGHPTRRDEASPSDWIRVLIDSFHDRRTRVRVRGQSGRRQAGHATGSTTATTTRAGTRCGTSAVARRARLARRVPHSVLAAAVPPVRDRRRSGWPSCGRSAG